MFLTRDAKLASRRDIGAAVFLLGSNDPAEQLRDVSRHFGIGWDPDAVMTRCRWGPPAAPASRASRPCGGALSWGWRSAVVGRSGAWVRRDRAPVPANAARRRCSPPQRLQHRWPAAGRAQGGGGRAGEGAARRALPDQLLPLSAQQAALLWLVLLRGARAARTRQARSPTLARPARATPRQCRQVPERIFEIVSEFYECSGCDKMYWVGPKSESAMQLMESLFAGKRAPTPLRSWKPPQSEPPPGG